VVNPLRRVELVLRNYLGLGFWSTLLFLVGMAVAGVSAGLLFPKFEGTGMLQFPEAQKPQDPKERPGDQRVVDPKANVIELSAYKRVAASYDSADQLRAYVEAVGRRENPAAARLLRQVEAPGFWEKAAVPVLPFSRRDQKEFGDIKDASATAMLGLELTTDARTEATAQDMVMILAAYYTNAVLRERMRAWILAGKVDALSQLKVIQADILRAELDIDLYGRRADDMKGILARNPDAARMDARQVVSVNPAEGGERYLSPLAQLVGAESAISQRRELIRRWQREHKQKEVLAQFFREAEAELDRETDVSKLLSALRVLSAKTFAHPDSAQEWSREAALRVNGALDNFEVMRSQFGVRNGVRVGAVSSRDPLRLGVLGAAAGVLLFAGLAFVRGTLRAILSEDPAEQEVARHA
jgi:hypothetical protein